MFTQENVGSAHVLKQPLHAQNLKRLDQDEILVPSFVKTLLKNEEYTKTYGVTKPKFWGVRTCARPTSTKRFAFYQAGKCLVQTLLLNHPKTSLYRLTKSKNNVVCAISSLRSIETPTNLETLLVGFYAGDAGELFTGLSKMEIDHRFFLSPNTDKVDYVQKVTFLHAKLSKNKVFARNAHTKVRVKARGAQNNKKIVQVRARLPYPNNSKVKNDVLEVLDRKQTLFSLTNSLSHKQDKTVLNSLDCFGLANRLNCTKIKQFLYKSDTGLFERTKATSLIQFIKTSGSICSQNIFNLQQNSIVGNLNQTEIKEKKAFSLFQSLEEQLQSIYLQANKQTLSSGNKSSFLTNSYRESVTKQKFATEPFFAQAFQSNNLLDSKKINCISQQKEISAWCEEIVCKSLAFCVKPYGHWFRIYLPQIETHQRQPVSLDQFFKKRRELGFLEDTKITSCKPLYSVTKFGDLIKPNIVNVSSVSVPLSYATSRVSFLLVVQKSNNTKKELVLKRINAYKALYAKALSKNGRYTKTNVFEDTRIRNLNNVFTHKVAHAWPQGLSYGMSHNLVLNTFTQAFNVIHKNRELLDILADHLIRFGKIRAPEISRICSLYVDTTNVFVTSVD